MEIKNDIKIFWITYGLLSCLFEGRKNDKFDQGEICRVTVGDSHISIYGDQHNVRWDSFDRTFKDGVDGHYFIYGDQNWADAEVLAGGILAIMDTNDVTSIDEIMIDIYYRHE